ncbi:MAG: UDP-glucose/GDP-mannose dehydrogenase family protein [Spirochaetales bacterium]|nr:UDP-glucose/GDP-mannose dehydrogenase family protein [Spirochaetales bacterium]
MSKNICVVGTGYVGLIAAVGLADFGNQVIAVDKNAGKIKMLQAGKSPIYEPGLSDYLQRNLEAGRLAFTTDTALAIRESDVVFIAVGTPEGFDGQPNMNHVTEVVHSIADNLDSYKVIVIKSTVPVGTNRRIEKYLKTRCSEQEFDVVSNPEFLREGSSVQDFFHPDRTVIGHSSERAKQVMFEVYRALNLISVPFLWCSLETAELIKYASNAFLATKITYINQMANLAEEVGADIHQVAGAMGMDGRISAKFLHPGPGYGGSCFPKDTKAIVATGDQYGVDMSLIREVVEANEKQKKRVVSRLEEKLDSLAGKTVAILGLAFKQRTDDVRESPSITIVNELIFRDAQVKAHDPEAMDNFKKHFPYIDYCENWEEAVKDAHVLIIATEWNEYRSLDPRKMRETMKGNLICDTRNLLDPRPFMDMGFDYMGTGRPFINSKQLSEIRTVV